MQQKYVVYFNFYQTKTHIKWPIRIKFVAKLHLLVIAIIVVITQFEPQLISAKGKRLARKLTVI